MANPFADLVPKASAAVPNPFADIGNPFADLAPGKQPGLLSRMGGGALWLLGGGYGAPPGTRPTTAPGFPERTVEEAEALWRQIEGEVQESRPTVDPVDVLADVATAGLARASRLGTGVASVGFQYGGQKAAEKAGEAGLGPGGRVVAGVAAPLLAVTVGPRAARAAVRGAKRRILPGIEEAAEQGLRAGARQVSPEAMVGPPRPSALPPPPVAVRPTSTPTGKPTVSPEIQGRLEQAAARRAAVEEARVATDVGTFSAEQAAIREARKGVPPAPWRVVTPGERVELPSGRQGVVESLLEAGPASRALVRTEPAGKMVTVPTSKLRRAKETAEPLPPPPAALAGTLPPSPRPEVPSRLAEAQRGVTKAQTGPPGAAPSFGVGRPVSRRMPDEPFLARPKAGAAPPSPEEALEPAMRTTTTGALEPVERVSNMAVESVDAGLEGVEILKHAGQRITDVPVLSEKELASQVGQLRQELGLSPKNVVKFLRQEKIGPAEVKAAQLLMAEEAQAVHRLALAAKEGTAGARDEFARRFNALMEVTAAVGGEVTRGARILRFQRTAPEMASYAGRLEERLRQVHGRGDVDALIREVAATPPEMTKRIAAQAAIPGFWDKLFELRLMGMLSSPKTHAVNVASNTLTVATAPAETGMAAVLDVGRRAIRGGPRERFFGEVGAETRGMRQAFATVIGSHEAGTTLALGPALRAYMEDLGQLSKVEFRPAIGGRLGTAVRLPGRALDLEDRFFKAIAFGGEYSRLVYREAAKEGLRGGALKRRIAEIMSEQRPELTQAAAEEAAIRTFTNRLDGTVGRAAVMARQVPGVRWFIPFLRTPLNIAKYGVKRTPVGMLNAFVKYGKGKIGASQLTDELAQATVGSLIMGGVATWAANGYVTGGGPVDPSRRRAWYDSGHQPYSVRIGDNWVNYGRLEPAGIVAGLAADMVELQEIVEPEDAIMKLVESVSKNLANKTFLSGLTDMINALSDPERYGENMIQRFAGSFVPAGVAAVERAASGGQIRKPETLGEAVVSRVPGLSDDVPVLRDIFGQPVSIYGPEAARPETTGGMIARGIEETVSPFRRVGIVPDKSATEVYRLDASPGSPQRHLVKYGIKLDLESPEYQRYVELSGGIAKQAIDRFVTRPGYDRIPDGRKAETIRKIFDMAREQARRSLWREFPGMGKRLAAGAREAQARMAVGLPPPPQASTGAF